LKRKMLPASAFVITLFINFICASSIQAKQRPEWDVSFEPGDKVCVHDIAESDPLVDDHNDSLKYWDNSKSGDGKMRRILRGSVRRLVFRVLQPGITPSGRDKDGGLWHSGRLVAIYGGHKPSQAKSYIIKRGQNELFGQEGRPWILDWSVIHFEKARFKKKGNIGSCMRKYPKF
jgi:hypothetical protein